MLQSASRGVCLVQGGGGVPGPRGGGVCSGGVSVPRGVCLVRGGGGVPGLVGVSAPGGGGLFPLGGGYPSMH